MFQQGEFRDDDEPVLLAKNAVDRSASGFGMVELRQRAGVEKIAHGSAVAASADDFIGEGTRDASEQLLGFLEIGKAVQPGKFGAAARDVFDIQILVERFDRDRYALMLSEPERRDRAEDPVLVDCIYTRGHNSILSLVERPGGSR